MVLMPIWLIVVGLLGASGFIIAKKPNAEAIFKKVVPYQGWAGVISLVWGAWKVIDALVHINVVKYVPGLWLTALLSALTLFVLGIIFGVGVIKSFANVETKKKMEGCVQKLVPFQSKIGLLAIALGIWGIIAYIVW